MALCILDNGFIHISISDTGAELSSLCDPRGRELLWQGRSGWKRRAPILFPIIGRMPGGLLTYDGVDYPIAQHGFARDAVFQLSDQTHAFALFTLVDSAETRVHFPFGFRLEVRFTLDRSTVTVETTVSNADVVSFCASLGQHPAFAWPLVPGIAREAHTVEFADPEALPVRRILDGLLAEQSEPTPVVGNILALRDSLFENDALIFDRLTSRSVRYTAPGAPVISLRFDDYHQLGLWSQLPEEFICIEPWFGLTAPVGFSGDYRTKPHQFELEPGESRRFSYRITVDLPVT